VNKLKHIKPIGAENDILASAPRQRVIDNRVDTVDYFKAEERVNLDNCEKLVETPITKEEDGAAIDKLSIGDASKCVMLEIEASSVVQEDFDAQKEEARKKEETKIKQFNEKVLGLKYLISVNINRLNKIISEIIERCGRQGGLDRISFFKKQLEEIFKEYEQLKLPKSLALLTHLTTDEVSKYYQIVNEFVYLIEESESLVIEDEEKRIGELIREIEQTVKHVNDAFPSSRKFSNVTLDFSLYS
jgi:hypothetical protein